MKGIFYEPGDHVGVCPMNKVELVNGILEKLSEAADPDGNSQLQILNEKHTSNGSYCWKSFLNL